MLGLCCFICFEMFPNVSFFHLFLPFLYFPFYCQESCSSFWKTFIYSGTAQMPQKEPPTRDFFNIFGWCPAQKKLCSGCEQIFFIIFCTAAVYFLCGVRHSSIAPYSAYLILSRLRPRRGRVNKISKKIAKKKSLPWCQIPLMC